MKAVSVIVANYNKADFLSEMIESVLKQTYQNWELIIVDDCSTDVSVKIIQNYCSKDTRIKILLNEINKGGNFSRNRGLKVANGNYIIFMDSDDLFTEYCFQQRINVAAANKNNDLWVFPMGVFKKKIGDCSEEMYWKVDGTDYLKGFLSHKLPWQTCQPMWDVKAIKFLEGFDEKFVRLQDVEIHTRALLARKRVHVEVSAEFNCFFRIDEQRISVNQFKFLSNFSKGAIQYYTKFYQLVSDKHKKVLVGTLIEVLSNICYQRRVNNISQDEFSELTNNVVAACEIPYQKNLLKVYVKLEKLLPFHPKGLKKIVLLLS